MERPTVPDKLKKFIRAVLLSKEGGVPVKQLCRDYRNLLGDELEWRGLGFTTLGDFVKAMPDVCRLEAFGPEKELRLYGIGDPDSYMSGAAIKAQKVKGPPKSATRQQRRQGQRSSPNRNGAAKSCWDGRSHDSGENPYGLQPVCGLYSVCMERRLDCTDQDIKRFFSAAGFVQQVHHTDRYTFVRFNTAREATAALDKLPSVLMGRSVRIQPASTRKKDSSASLESGRRQLTDKWSPTVSKAERPTSPFPVHELIVSQLTRDTTEEEVWNLFAPFGASNVRVRKEGPIEYGHAFVHFDSSESVDRARVALNNSVLNGQKILVNLTKRAEEHRFAAEHCRGAQLQHSRPAAVPSVSSNPDKQGHPAGPSTTSGTGLSTASHLKASSNTEYSTVQVQVQVQQHKNLCPTPKFMSYSTMAQMMCECSDDQGEPVAPTPAASYPEELNVIVTEVVDGCHLWGQVNLEGKNNLLELQELQKGLNQLCPAPPLPPGEKTGAAPFEGEWYRVWVQEELPEDQLQLMFVDYGNTAVLPRTEVSPLLIPALWDLPPQAIPFKLAGLTPSTSNGPDKLKELVSWQVVSMKQSQCGTCEPHILEVEVYVPGISDSVNKLMKKETSGEDPPLTQKPFKGSELNESKLLSNINKVVPVTDSKASDHSIPGQKMATKEKETRRDVFSNNKTASQDTKHCLEIKETDRKFSHRIFNQRSEEKDYQKLESPFLSKQEEAVFDNLIGNNQQSGKQFHTDVGRRSQKTGNRVGEGCKNIAVVHKVPSLSTQSSRGAPFPGLTLLKDMAAQWQQGLMGGQQATVQHPKGLLGTPVTEYSPQLQYKGQTFGLDVKVTEVVTPELFYIQAADCTLLDIVSQGLQEAANKRTAQDLEDMKTLCHDTGQVMCSYSEKHHMWRRVRTVIVQPNMVTVHHVDYGTTDCTQQHNLFPLPHSLLSVPMLARPGCLANTAPLPNDHGDWTEGADAFLKGLTAGKVLYAEVCEQSGSKLVVSLWDSREKKLNLSQQLIGQNYAIHSRSLVPQPPSYPIVQQQNKPFLAMCQPPQISNQPFFVQDQKPHFPIPRYPVSSHLPQQHPAPRRRITLEERFTQLGNQRTQIPVLGGGGAFKMMERADEGNDRFTSRGDRSGPPVGQLHGERKYVKKDPRDQETCYRPTAQNMSGNKGERSSATTSPTKLASSKEVHTSRKQFEPKNSTWATHRGNRGGKKIGRCVSPLSPEAQRNILKQIVGDMEKTSDTSQAGSDCGPADKPERERRSTGDSEVSMELASRLEQLIQTDTEDGRESPGGCTPNSKSPTAKQHQKGPLAVDFQSGLPNTCGKSAVDILTSQLIELHTEE